MNKLFLPIFLGIMIILASCTDEYSNAKIEPDDLSKNQTVELAVFENYNSSLPDNWTETRGWIDTKKFLTIVSADAKGAYSGWKWSEGQHILVRIVISAVVGIGASCVAGLTYQGAPNIDQSRLAINNLSELCLIYQENPEIRESMDFNPPTIGIQLPAEFEQFEQIGILHNCGLYSMHNNIHPDGTPSIDISHELDSKYAYVNRYNHMLMHPQDVMLSTQEWQTVFGEPIGVEDQVFDLFCYAIENKTNNVNEVVSVANDYIVLTDKSELNANQKAAVISGIVTMVYSASYWSQISGIYDHI